MGFKPNICEGSQYDAYCMLPAFSFQANPFAVTSNSISQRMIIEFLMEQSLRSLKLRVSYVFQLEYFLYFP